MANDGTSICQVRWTSASKYFLTISIFFFMSSFSSSVFEKHFVLLMHCTIAVLITLPAPCISESCIKIKVNLTLPTPIPDKEKKLTQIFIFTLLSGASKGFMKALWCLKRFYEGLKGLYKTFCGTTEKCENENLS